MLIAFVLMKHCFYQYLNVMTNQYSYYHVFSFELFLLHMLINQTINFYLHFHLCYWMKILDTYFHHHWLYQSCQVNLGYKIRYFRLIYFQFFLLRKWWFLHVEFHLQKESFLSQLNIGFIVQDSLSLLLCLILICSMCYQNMDFCMYFIIL